MYPHFHTEPLIYPPFHFQVLIQPLFPPPIVFLCRIIYPHFQAEPLMWSKHCMWPKTWPRAPSKSLPRSRLRPFCLFPSLADAACSLDLDFELGRKKLGSVRPHFNKTWFSFLFFVLIFIILFVNQTFYFEKRFEHNMVEIAFLPLTLTNSLCDG